MSSIEPFNRLVKLAARAFYDDFTTKGDNQGHRSRDNRGITVVVLDALCRRQWVREEDLAKDLKLHSKQLRRTLQFFEEEKLVTRNHRKTTKALSDGTKQGEEKIKLHTQSYCCLEYAQIYDVVRYKLHRMKKKLKDELEGDKTVQEYVCPNPNCGKRYNAFDAMLLISIEDGCFRCQTCNRELIVAESDNNLALNSHKVGVGVGDGDSNAIRTQKRREKLKDMLRNMEVQLKPLMEQINRVKELPAPQFGTLRDWEAREFAQRRLENGESSAIDPSKPSHWYGGTKVEVNFGSQGEDNDIKSEADTTSLKVMPPWMIMQGMKLTKEQRGDVEVNQNQEAITKIDGPSLVVGPEYSDDKTYKDEYVKAFCAAVAAKLQEQQQEEATKNRQVGMKSKRNDEGDDNLNVEEDATAEDEDDIDWEE